MEKGKSQPSGPSFQRETRRASFPTGTDGPSGWDFPISTDHPWWILFIYKAANKTCVEGSAAFDKMWWQTISTIQKEPISGFFKIIIWACAWENQQFAWAKTKTQISFAVTAKLISVFVFATRIVHFLLYLFPNFQDSGFLLWLYRLVCVGPGRKPKLLVFSCTGSFFKVMIINH